MSDATSTLQLSGEPVTGLALWRRKLGFGMAVRAEVWQSLADVVESQVELEEALKALIEGYWITGRRARALVLAEMQSATLNAALPERLARYVSPSERLILGQIGKQEAHRIFGSAARLLRSQLALRKALSEAVAMPLLLVAGLIGLTLFFGLQLLPALSEVIDLETITGVQGVIVRGTLAFSANPGLSGLVLLGIGTGFLLAMRFWTGPGRAFADRLPPFSVMRLRAGMGFLFAVIEAGRSGEIINGKFLEDMAGHTGRYEASRIRALIEPMPRLNDNVGAAALVAGQGFPDDVLAPQLRLLWNRAGGFDKLGQFLDRRVAQVESDIRTRMKVLNVALMVAVAAALLALLSIALPIIDQINNSAGVL